LYLAAILDLFSRFIVGWAVSAVNDRHLTIAALAARGESLHGLLAARCERCGFDH
jgi:transposase InsO family protein